jgi:hypothetical protein
MSCGLTGEVVVTLGLGWLFFCHDPALRSRYSDCVTDWTVRGSNSGKGEEFSSAERPDRHWQPTSYSVRTGVFLVVKRPDREVNYSPPPRAEDKNEWTYTSTPPICLHSVDRKKLTLTFLPFCPRCCWTRRLGCT